MFTKIDMIDQLPMAAKIAFHAAAVSATAINIGWYQIIPWLLGVISGLLVIVWWMLNIYVFVRKHFKKGR